MGGPSGPYISSSSLTEAERGGHLVTQSYVYSCLKYTYADIRSYDTRDRVAARRWTVADNGRVIYLAAR